MPTACGGASAEAPLRPHGPIALVPRRRRAHAILVTIRPRQWIKNGLVVAAAGAAGALGHDDVPVHVALACAAFCLLASGAYAINDVRDADEDRLHPRKRFRPVAARELTPGAALTLGFCLMLGGLAVCALVRPLLVAVGAGYLALTLSYTVLWRHVVLLDVLAIAGGFVLRAIAGGVAAPVALSRWFVLVVTAVAVFVAAGKRQAELRRSEAGPAQRRSEAGPAQRRRVLALYTPPVLRLILTGSIAVALFAYCVWAFQLATISGIPWRELTIVPFAACLLRYGALARAGDGEAPEEVLLRDRWMQLAGAAWLVLFAVGVHAAE
ncbi:MAG: decaprenyl-phosphate phosphoribosyltransferase [Solirubrobacterales bacterium]|nr:MAG: decaprenyl-phosphate phosphoribosyltransferase [Solirubrobacterales bacterium]PZS10034.1 MAG: decaprenyl-phosphate phosphoribosyltransferase [Solirubrobacterales bacterium]